MAFAVAIPFVAVSIQILIYSADRVYAKAYAKLKKFLRHYSYLSPSTAFAFNKKVARVFPRHIKRQTKQIADSAMPLEEYLNTFNFCPCRQRGSIVAIIALAHIVLLGVVVAMNGFEVGVVSTAVLATFALWVIMLVFDNVIGKLFVYVDRKFKKKFIVKLDANIIYEEKQIDLTLPKAETPEDSVMQLAGSVEDFLASRPDKGIAKVVLKGLYSAKFSSAMTAQSKLRLKNVVTQLKNYVG